MTEPQTSKNNRKFRNLFIAPNQQFSMFFFSVIIGLGTLLLFLAFQIWVFSTLIAGLVPMLPQNLNIEPILAQSIRMSWIGFGLGALFFTSFVVFSILLVTHRIYGPMVAIRKHLSAILRGEYDHSTQLRKNDEFKEVAEDLNRLSEILRDKT